MSLFSGMPLKHSLGNRKLCNLSGRESAFVSESGIKETRPVIHNYSDQLCIVDTQLRARIIDYANPHWKEAFISPLSANGTVVQLAESDRADDEERPPRLAPELERLLRGQ